MTRLATSSRLSARVKPVCFTAAATTAAVSLPAVFVSSRAARFRVATHGARADMPPNPGRVSSGFATTSVTAPGSKALCVLYGSSRAFAPATLKMLYGTKAQYLTEFDDATGQAVSDGYVLSADQAALEAQARAVRFPA